METLTDNALMMKVKAGDLDKMGLLFARHHRQLYGFLFHMTYHKEASEDMVQHVFYKMLKYRHTFTGTGEFISWMFSIARNVLKDRGRKKQLPMQQAGVEDFADQLPGGASPGELLEKKQAREQLYRAMAQLSDTQREILTLSRFQELKNKEVADLLGMSEVAVRTRICRAMQELKTIYQTMEL